MRGDTVVIGGAGDLDKVSLSAQALPPSDAAPASSRKGPQAPRTARPPRALKPEEVAIKPGDALVTVRLTGMAEQGGRTLIFTRQGPAPDIQPWENDGRPALFAVALPTRGAARGDRTRAVTQTFSVPPGRWRLSAVNMGPYITHFCLGASLARLEIRLFFEELLQRVRGFRVVPEVFEFWYGAEFRLHERWRYECDAAGEWDKRMLYP